MTHRVEGGGGLSCVVDTERGGRIVHLTSAAGATGATDDYEWLAPATDAWPPAAAAGGQVPFVREGMGGWDEACPTVAASTLQSGAALPDHGDAWRTPWSVEHHEPQMLRTSVLLRSLPVTLRRTISATADGLRLAYAATTTSSQALPLLWSAHPQFVAQPGDTVELEKGSGDHLVEQYPRPGERHGIETAATPHLERLLPGRSLKVFVEPVEGAASRGGGATLRRAGDRELRMRWGGSIPLYTGLFWDRHEFAEGSVIAIEPSTGLGDAAAHAERTSRIAMLEQKIPVQWWIEVVAH